MLDDFTSTNPLDGTWEGYYDHDNKIYSSKNFPVTAMIVQQGRSFRGTMIDGVTDIRHFYRTIVEANEGRMSPWTEHQARLTLEMFPDYQIESSLPEESLVEGQIVGDQVCFTKTYLGTHSIYGNAGRRRVLLRQTDRHRVTYQGILIEGGNVIEGKWTIWGGGFLGLFRRPLGTGDFQLFRKK
jgi:hypothetical protein